MFWCVEGHRVTKGDHAIGHCSVCRRTRTRVERGTDVVIDKPRRWNGKTPSAHLACRSVDNLIRFAQKIGVRPRLHRHPYVHLDLFGRNIRKALEAGARQVDSKELLIIAREAR